MFTLRTSSSGDDPGILKVDGGVVGEFSIVRVRLTREMVVGLVDGKHLVLYFQLDNGEAEGGVSSGARRT